MKILKFIGMGLVTLIVLLLIVATILPSQAHISRTIEIQGDALTIYNTIADFNNYKKWNPWSQKEPSAENEMGGKPLMPGHSWHWKGTEIGEGSLTLDKLDPG